MSDRLPVLTSVRLGFEDGSAVEITLEGSSIGGSRMVSVRWHVPFGEGLAHRYPPHFQAEDALAFVLLPTVKRDIEDLLNRAVEQI